MADRRRAVIGGANPRNVQALLAAGMITKAEAKRITDRAKKAAAKEAKAKKKSK